MTIPDPIYVPYDAPGPVRLLQGTSPPFPLPVTTEIVRLRGEVQPNLERARNYDDLYALHDGRPAPYSMEFKVALVCLNSAEANAKLADLRAAVLTCTGVDVEDDPQDYPGLGGSLGSPVYSDGRRTVTVTVFVTPSKVR